MLRLKKKAHSDRCVIFRPHLQGADCSPTVRSQGGSGGQDGGKPYSQGAERGAEPLGAHFLWGRAGEAGVADGLLGGRDWKGW